MLSRRSIGATAAVLAVLLAALSTTLGGAFAFDDAQYPNLKGQWVRARPPAGVTGQGPFDPDKSWGLGQQAPLTPEYQKVFEASLADQAAGGQGQWQGGRCLAIGMPAMMTLFRPMEIVIMPDVTYIRIDHIRESRRRIFTDGRAWSDDIRPSFDGYSIGHWLDTQNKGRFDTLEAETRYFKGPRAFEPSGLPLHADNQSIIKERLFLDATNKNILHNQITVIDHALTRPWTVMKDYYHVSKVEWHEDLCSESNNHVVIGKENYFLSGDGFLMPAKKDQPPPDLRYFKQTRK
jgi:hypothetical protein